MHVSGVVCGNGKSFCLSCAEMRWKLGELTLTKTGKVTNYLSVETTYPKQLIKTDYSNTHMKFSRDR